MDGRRARACRPVSSLPPGLLACLVLLLLLALPALPASARAPYQDGERIQLTGLVTDPAGLPLANLHVVLEASRSAFSLRRFSREKKDTTRLMGLTNQRGEYTLEWPWNGFYNTFELVVGVPIRRPDGERLRVLERLDLSRKVERGSPVVTAVVVAEASFVSNLRQFLATIDSEDERQVHREMGEPERVEEVDHGSWREVSWWYFASGKVYRFRDGRLERVEPFPPVKEGR